MQKVDFYILSSTQPQARLEFSVKLAEQLYRKQLRIHLTAGDDAQLKLLDERLWTARDVSFIPHEVSTELIANCPVTLSMGELNSEVDILLNLGNSVPACLSQAQRIVEVINKQDEHVDAGRERYRFYKDGGYPITNHDINDWN